MSTQKPINPWSYKPWWCQPWSIILTGITIICCGWILTKSILIIIFVSIPIAVWMGYFLLIWPRLMQHIASIEEQNASEATIQNE